MHCRTSLHNNRLHPGLILQALVPLLAEEEPDTLAACWDALAATTASIPKDMQPSFVRCLKVSPLPRSIDRSIFLVQHAAGHERQPGYRCCCWLSRLLHASVLTCPALRTPTPHSQDAVLTARDKERRKRRGGRAQPLPGFCLPKALSPVLPIYLQGVLQVRGGGGRASGRTCCRPCAGPAPAC